MRKKERKRERTEQKRQKNERNRRADSQTISHLKNCIKLHNLINIHNDV